MGIKVSRITREVNLEANKLRSKRGKIQYQQISNKCCQIDILAPTGAEMHLIFYYKGIPVTHAVVLCRNSSPLISDGRGQNVKQINVCDIRSL